MNEFISWKQKINFVCIILGLLLCSFGAFAFDPGITNATHTGTITEAQPATFTLSITNYQSDDNYFTAKLYHGTQLIDQNTYYIHGFETATFVFTTTMPNGYAHYDFNLISPIDNNEYNNSFSQDLNVLRGPDLAAGNITLNNYNVREGNTIHITGLFSNSGDTDIFAPIKANLWHNTTKIFSTTINNLLPNTTAGIETDYLIPSGLNDGQTIKLTLDDENNSPEKNRANNFSTTTFSVTGDNDLSIDSTDINFTEPLRVGYQSLIQFSVRNIGGRSLQNVLIRAWHTTKTDNTILYSSTNSFEVGEKKALSFYYTPQTIGTDTFYFEIDPLLDLNEQNRTNNVAQKSFNVTVGTTPTDSNGYFYSKNITIRGDCFVLFNNNDKLLTTGIQKVEENSLEYCVNLKFTDAWGNELLNKSCVRANDSFNLSGRTINLLSVNSNYANLFIVFSTPVSDFYSNCEVNVAAISDQLTSCQSNLKDTTSKLDTCNSIAGNNEGGYSSCLKNIEDCRGNLSTCQFNLTNSNTACDTRVNEKTNEKNTELNNTQDQMNATIQQLQNNLNYSDLIAFIGWLIVFLGAGAITLFLYLKHYKGGI